SLHVVETSEDPEGRVRARIHPGERVNRDFILRFSYGSQDAVGHALTTVPDADGLPSGYFQLTALPPREASAAARPRDVVVVLDRSGSMSGWKMTAARRAASRIVDTLSSRDRFAVRCFDNQITVPDGLDDGLVPASDRNRYRAVEHLGRTNARGGTEMLGPLNEAVDLLRAAEPGHDRIVVLVTDGQVGNEDQILARLDGRLDGIRIHVIGIDRAVNAGFLHRLALAGRGRCELVESEDRLDAAAAHIHRRIVAPVVTSLSLTGEGVDVVDGTLAPARLPDLFTGVPLVLWGRYDNAVDDAELVLTGVDADGEPWRRAVSSRHAADDGVKEMWGRARLRDLEDRYAAAPRSGKLTPERPDAPATLTELEQLIVETSLGCGVLSRFTAFTAVDTRVVVDEGGEPRTVVQPVELPEGWEMPLAPGAGAPAPTHLSAAPMMIAAPMANPEAAGPSGPVAPLGFKTASGDAGSAPSDPVARTRRTAPGKSRRGRSKLLDLDQIRKILAAELRILDPEFRTLEWKPPEVIARERRAMLSDLATRLGVVADALEQLP
ncbi:MAG: VWA domain-containing protein, partial [Stackebrandtia sp.]